MEQKPKIPFRNKPFMALVSGCGDQRIQCTPIVYDAKFNCGVGILYDEGQLQFWGMVCPRNLIAAWRGTEVLRLLDVIGHSTLHDAYHTGLRNPTESDLERTVEPMIEEIGRVEYQRIMSLPVPEEIINAILDNQDEEFKPDLYPIVQEVRAGTIKWRDEFAEAGIKHPDVVDAEAKAQDALIAKFEDLLALYANSARLPRQCIEMNHVEGALLTILGKGASKIYSDRIVVALAGAVGGLATAEFALLLMPIGPRSQARQSAMAAEDKQKALTKSARWLSAIGSMSGFSLLRLFSGKKEGMSFEEAKALLDRLLTEYFPPKQEEATA